MIRDYSNVYRACSHCTWASMNNLKLIAVSKSDSESQTSCQMHCRASPVAQHDRLPRSLPTAWREALMPSRREGVKGSMQGDAMCKMTLMKVTSAMG